VTGFRASYDHTPATCFTLDRDLRVRFANCFGLRMLGYRPPEMLGQPVAAFHAPADCALAEGYLHDALTVPSRLHRWKVRRRKKNGELIWMRETVRTLVHDHDTLFLMTCEDIDDACGHRAGQEDDRRVRRGRSRARAAESRRCEVSRDVRAPRRNTAVAANDGMNCGGDHSFRLERVNAVTLVYVARCDTRATDLFLNSRTKVAEPKRSINCRTRPLHRI